MTTRRILCTNERVSFEATNPFYISDDQKSIFRLLYFFYLLGYLSFQNIRLIVIFLKCLFCLLNTFAQHFLFFLLLRANPNLGLARSNEARTRYKPEKITTRPDPARQKVDPNPTRKKYFSLGSARPDFGLRDPTTRSGWPGPCRALIQTNIYASLND